MKDITVALELTVPKDMSDESVQMFVETAIKHALIEHQITNYEVDQDLIDVVAITDGGFIDFVEPDWRKLPRTHP